jgi:hypothetical protein
MLDFTSTQAQAKELAHPASRGEAEATAAKTPSASTQLTADGLDMMYRQLAEIHTITTA